jgi:hypothetical protein
MERCIKGRRRPFSLGLLLACVGIQKNRVKMRGYSKSFLLVRSGIIEGRPSENKMAIIYKIQREKIKPATR